MLLLIWFCCFLMANALRCSFLDDQEEWAWLDMNKGVNKTEAHKHGGAKKETYLLVVEDCECSQCT